MVCVRMGGGIGARLTQTPLWIVGALLAGCSVDVPPQVGETEHIRYYSSEAACGQRTAEWLELSYQRLLEALPTPMPPEEPIDYYQVGPATTAAVCGSSWASGCFTGGDVFAKTRAYHHELVHALLEPLGPAPQVLEEGIAQAYTSQYLSSVVATPSHDLARLLYEVGSFSSDDRDERFTRYLRSASFVRFLIERFSIESFLSLYEAIPQRASRSEIDRRFLEVLGVSVQEVMEEWVEAGPRPAYEIAWPVVPCSSPAIRDGSAQVVSLGCGVEHYVFSPIDGDRAEDLPPVSAYRSLRTFADEQVFLQVRGSQLGTLDSDLIGCGVNSPAVDAAGGFLPFGAFHSSRFPSPGAGASGERMMLLSAPPGRYAVALNILGTAKRADDVELSMSRGDWLGETCEGASAVRIDDVQELLIERLTRARGPSWIRIRVERDLEMTIVPMPIEEGAGVLPFVEARLYDAECEQMWTVDTPEELAARAEAPLAAGQEYVLFFEPRTPTAPLSISLWFNPDA